MERMELGRLMWPPAMLLVLMTSVLLISSSCYGCWETERTALLHLRDSLNHPNGGSLRSWGTHTNCCLWEGVECHATTNRVMNLVLNFTRDDRLPPWDLNCSLFLPFQDLRALYLTGNQIGGCMDTEGFNKLSSLKNLAVLDLSTNLFRDFNALLSSLSEISSLTSLGLEESVWGLDMPAAVDYRSFQNLRTLENLEFLDLSWNNLGNGIIPYLAALSSLKTLDLSHNRLEGTLHAPGAEENELLKLGNLEVLDLQYNHLGNKVFSSLRRLPSLKILNLNENNINGSLLTTDVNALRDLEELHLGNNDIDEFISPQGFQNLWALKNLEFLDLSGNNLGNGIIPYLAALSSLKTLDLSFNRLKGTLHAPEFIALRNLEELYLDSNDIDEFICPQEMTSLSKLKVLEIIFTKDRSSHLLQLSRAFPMVKSLHLSGSTLFNQSTSFSGFEGFKHLEELYLDSSSLDQSFLESIREPNSIKLLSLKESNLTGTLHSKGWCALKNLQVLNLANNNLQGTLPSCLRNLTSLRLLDISENLLTGDITATPFPSLSLLVFLSISDNDFRCPASFSPFMNNSKLRVLVTDNNELISESDFQAPPPTFQLYVFSSTNMSMEKLPEFLYSQNYLLVLDLSYNNLTGMFPLWLMRNNSRLEILQVRNNFFIGSLTLPLLPNSNLLLLDVAKNKMGGKVPQNFGLVFPKLQLLIMDENEFEVIDHLESQSLEYLSLSNNRLVGKIPHSLGNITTLRYLDLSNNALSGEVPRELISGCCLPLMALRLSNNNLEGEIYPMHLGGNNFKGDIEDFPSPSFLSMLASLDIKNNSFSGKLPRWISTIFPGMDLLDMSNNHFEGPIPKEFCQLQELSYLDISSNNLSGSIPSCLYSMPKLLHVHLGQNQLKGNLTFAFNESSPLVTLDLSNNHLSGGIPMKISSFLAMCVLLLKGNNFQGEIPIQLCQMKELSLVDLSQNNLSGHLPHCLSNLTFAASDKKAKIVDLAMLGIEIKELYIDLMPDFGKTSLPSGHVASIWQNYMDSRWFKYNFDQIDHMEEQVKFSTKRSSYMYKGNILDFMAGLDLSGNHLFGQITLDIGNLSQIHALNLSHNNFTGFIPLSFSNLRQIESLDLSHNHLTGEIPRELIDLNALAIFSVAFNNLLGPIPEQKGQFGTFDETSYQGNLLLCGAPIHTSCDKIEPPSRVPINKDGEDKDSLFDINFYVSFVVSYVMTVLVGIVVFLINPYWRQLWFHFIEVFITTIQNFVLDGLLRLRDGLRKNRA